MCVCACGCERILREGEGRDSVGNPVEKRLITLTGEEAAAYHKGSRVGVARSRKRIYPRSQNRKGMRTPYFEISQNFPLNHTPLPLLSSSTSISTPLATLPSHLLNAFHTPPPSLTSPLPPPPPFSGCLWECLSRCTQGLRHADGDQNCLHRQGIRDFS